MRVLLTVEFYWPHIGGAETVARRVAEGLAAAGHDVHVATGADPARPTRRLGGVTIHEFRVSGNEVKGMRGEVAAYRRFLRSFACDVMLNYAAQSWTTDVAFQELERLGAARRALVPCGYSGLSTPLRRLAYWRYFGRLPARLRRYDLLIYHVDGFRDVEFGRRHGLGHGVVIPNGVDAAELAAPAYDFRSRHGLDERPLVVNVSTHYRLKRHDRFFRLADRVGPLAHFALLGASPRTWRSCSGGCERRARGRSSPLLLDGTRPDVLAALRQADLLVLTSESEVFPLVLVEAAAAGVPWVAFDVGNARQLGGGVVVRDQARLEAAVAHLLRSPDERRALAERGREIVAELTWERLVPRYERALLALVEAEGPAPAWAR